MNKTGGNLHELTSRAAEYGLVLRGGFCIDVDEALPDCQPGVPAAMLMLFGQAGSSIWECFSASPEYADGKAHPMDRWSRRIGDSLAADWGGRALFPFEGPPWHPFGQWAQRAEAVHASPLGILMHPRYGLWHAYRFAIALPAIIDGWQVDDVASKIPAVRIHACDECVDKPCLQACPVDAFSQGHYDVAACVNHLAANKQAMCHNSGCLARDACPEARAWLYEPAHSRFHMRQFVASQS